MSLAVSREADANFTSFRELLGGLSALHRFGNLANPEDAPNTAQRE